MTKDEQLEKVKEALSITGNFQDKALMIYLEEVRDYLEGAGVNKSILDSEQAIGILSRGASDLWNYGSGNAALSPYFYERAIQLVYRSRTMEEGENAE